MKTNHRFHFHSRALAIISPLMLALLLVIGSSLIMRVEAAPLSTPSAADVPSIRNTLSRSHPYASGQALYFVEAQGLVKGDDTPPSSSVTSPVTQSFGRAPFSLLWSAQDADSGLDSITLFYTSSITSGGWLSYSTMIAAGHQANGAFVFTPLDDLFAHPIVTYSFATLARDRMGNSESLPATPDVQVIAHLATAYLPLVLKDFPPVPQGSVTIQNSMAYTYRRNVTLNLTATAAGDTVSQMRLRNEGEGWSAWQPFASAVDFTLPGGNSQKTVYAQFKGTLGGTSAVVSDSIFLFENGDFEQNLSNWQIEHIGLPIQLVTTAVDGTPITGTAMLLGNPGIACNAVPTEYASIAQVVTVPAAGGKLMFQYFMRTQDASSPTSHAYDAFEVYINGSRVYDDANRVTTGLSCANWWRIPGPQNPRSGLTSGWYEYGINLSGYTGQTITVAFRNYSRYDNYYNTYTYLDNVRIEP